MTDHDIGAGPLILAGWTHAGVADYLTLVEHETWSEVEARNVDRWADAWVIVGTPERLFAGDLDGDGNDVLVVFDGPELALEFDPSGADDSWLPVPLPTLGEPREAAFGDVDGDGDAELAVRTSLGEQILIYDG